MNERWDAFDRIWAKGKNGKMRLRLMEKCKVRGLAPTEENCRDYWMGYVRCYVDAWTGEIYHLNPRKNKQRMKMLKRRRYDKKGNSGKNRSGRKPHSMGRHGSGKNKGIQRRG